LQRPSDCGQLFPLVLLTLYPAWTDYTPNLIDHLEVLPGPEELLNALPGGCLGGGLQFGEVNLADDIADEITYRLFLRFHQES
jgi:hypothetical protein